MAACARGGTEVGVREADGYRHGEGAETIKSYQRHTEYGSRIKEGNAFKCTFYIQ